MGSNTNRLTVEELRQLDRDNPAEFNIRLQKLLVAKDLKGQVLASDDDEEKEGALDAPAIADMLRATDRTLVDLEIDGGKPLPNFVDDSGHRRKMKFEFALNIIDYGDRSYWWGNLKSCLLNSQPEDAIIIFSKMAQSLEGRPIEECADLMKTAFGCSWRLDAIDAAPLFFKVRRIEKYSASFFDPEDSESSNVLQVLALAGSNVDWDFESTLDIIQKLKSIGAADFPDPNNQATCVHWASLHHKTESFAAFVQEFPDELNSLDAWERTPLHWAAESEHPGNVSLLLREGVDPRPISKEHRTPLFNAASGEHFETVLVLLDTGAYSDDDVREVHSWFGEQQAAHLLAFHAAVKARQAAQGIEIPGSNPEPL